MYCNPDSALRSIERSRKILDCDDIEKINLSVGPMAISGSTRMQASTVLLVAIGIALLFEDPEKALSEVIELVRGSDFSFLKRFIERESKIYGESGIIYYDASAKLLMFSRW